MIIRVINFIFKFILFLLGNIKYANMCVERAKGREGTGQTKGDIYVYISNVSLSSGRSRPST